TGTLLTPPSGITRALTASEPSEDEDRLWQGLDIPFGPRFQYITWLRENGPDLMFAGEGKLICFDGFFVGTHDTNATTEDDWDNVRPQQVRDAIAALDGRRETQARSFGQLELLFFKTRRGSMGVLQIVGFIDDPAAVKIRYKLVGSTLNDPAEEREELSAR